MIKLLGKEIRNNDLELIKSKVIEYKSQLSFALFFSHDSPEAVSYTNMIEKLLMNLNIYYEKYPITKTKQDFQTLLKYKKKNFFIILARPLNYSDEKFISMLDPNYDPDMLTYENMGKLYSGNSYYLPATAKAVSRIIEHYKIEVNSKKVCVFGRSISVGLPLFMYFQQKNATCTLIHSKTDKKDIANIVKQSDIIVLATGKQGLIDKKWLNNKQIVIDCGYNANGLGDLGFIPDDDSIEAYTPVPGGVGPITISSLILNTIYLIEHKE